MFVEIQAFLDAYSESSIFAIIGIPIDQFIAHYENENDWTRGRLERVYREAFSVRERMLLTWACLKDAVSPYYRNVPFNNIPDTYLAYQASIPNYEQLFGSLDSAQLDASQTIFGPPAYLVDLLRFVDGTIGLAGKPGADGQPDPMSLRGRRPDLFYLPLDQDTTYTLVPAIDLVVEALEATIRGTDRSLDIDQMLAQAVFPPPLPFDHRREHVRACLAQNKLSFADLLAAFGADPTAVAQEQLGISPAESAIISTSILSGTTLPWTAVAPYYGVDAQTAANPTALLSQLSAVKTFLGRVGLSRQDLDELLRQDLSDDERNGGLHRLFFINNAEDGLEPLAIVDRSDSKGQSSELLVNLSLPRLDRIHRFVRLKQKLGWSSADLDWALRSFTTPVAAEKALVLAGNGEYLVASSLQRASQDKDGRLTWAPLTLSEFTIEAWVRLDATRVQPLLCMLASPASAAQGSPPVQPSADFVFGIGAEGFPFLRIGPSTAMARHGIASGSFHHVAVTVASCTNSATGQPELKVSFYLDGRPESDRFLQPPPSMAAADRSLYVGLDPSPAPPQGTAKKPGGRPHPTAFCGGLKDLRLWDQARTPAQIAQCRYRRMTGLEPGLAGYWPLTQDRANALSDRTRSHNHLQRGGWLAAAQPEWEGVDLVLEPLPALAPQQALHFNGRDQFLATTLPASLLPHTIEAWIQLEALGPDELPVLWKGTLPVGTAPGPVVTDCALTITSNGGLRYDSAWLSGSVYFDPVLVPGLLTHVCLTLTDHANLYVNGVLRQSVSVKSVAGSPQGTTFYVGRDSGSRRFGGWLAQLRLWDGARTADEVALAAFRAVSRFAPGLLADWPLDRIEADSAQPGALYARDASVYAQHLRAQDQADAYRPTPAASPIFCDWLPAPWYSGLPVQKGQHERLGLYLPDGLPKAARPGAVPRVLRFTPDSPLITFAFDEECAPGKDGELGLSLELWFQLAPSATAPRQVLLSHSESARGLAVYLDGNVLYIAAWAQEAAGGRDLKFVPHVLVDPDAWQYLRITDSQDHQAHEPPVHALINGERLALGGPCALRPRGRFHVGGIPVGDKLYFHDGVHVEASDKSTRYLGSITEGCLYFTEHCSAKGEPQTLLTFPTAFPEPVVSQMPVFAGSGPGLAIVPHGERLCLKDCTLELWFAAEEDVSARWQGREAHAAHRQLLLAHHGGDTELCVYLAGDKLWLHCWRHAGRDTALSFQASLLQSPRKWHHIAIVYGSDGTPGAGELHGYLDGELLTPATQSDSPSDPCGPFGPLAVLELGAAGADTIHCHDGALSAEHGFRGQLTELRVWDHARSSAEIIDTSLAHFGAAVPGLPLYVPLNDAKQPYEGQLPPSYQLVAPPEGPAALRFEASPAPPLWADRAIHARCFSFDGDKQHLLAADVRGLDATAWAAMKPGRPAAFTLCLWSRPIAAQKRQVFLSKGYRSAGLVDFAFGINEAGKLFLSRTIFDGDGNLATSEVNGDAILPVGVYTHVAVAAHDQAVRFYVNGQPDGDPRTLTGLTSDGPDLIVGTDLRLQHSYQGLVQELRIYHAACKAEELYASLFRLPRPDDERLVGYWPLDERTGDAGDKAPAAAPTTPLHCGSPVAPVFLPGCQEPRTRFFEPTRRCLTLAGTPAQPILVSAPAGSATVELWFQAHSLYVFAGKQALKQVILRAGDENSGVCIYLEDGSLKFAIGSGDKSVVVSTARVTAGRWHHAAFTLARHRELSAYLDAELIGFAEADAVDLRSLAIGGLAAAQPIPAVPGAGTAPLVGALLEVRLWHHVRTQEQLRDNLYGRPDVLGHQAGLAAYWDLDLADAQGKIPDLSHHGNPVHIPAQSLQAIGAEPSAVEPVATLDAQTLLRLAEVKGLMDSQGAQLDELSALWYLLRHSGRASQKPLFDRVYNASVSQAKQWSSDMRTPPIWDVDGQRDPQNDRALTSRLAAALGINRQDLRTLALAVSGGATILAVDGALLTSLYRLARLASLTALSIADFLRLMTLVQTPVQLDYPAFLTLEQLGTWLGTAKLSVSDLAYWLAAPSAAGDPAPYDSVALINGAQDLSRSLSPGGSSSAGSVSPDQLTGVIAAALGVDASWLTALGDAAKLPNAQDLLAEIIALTATVNAPVPASLDAVLRRLARLRFVGTRFQFGASVLAALVGGTLTLQLPDPLPTDLKTLESLAALGDLRQRWGATDDDLCDVFSASATALDTDRLGQLLRTFADELAAQASQLAIKAPLSLQDATKLTVCVAQAKTLQVDSLRLAKLLPHQDPATLVALAEVLEDGLRGNAADDVWARKSRPIHDLLTPRYRDALAAYVLAHQIPAAYRDSSIQDTLSGYLLTDVGWGPETDTSRMLQAITAVQTYVQRCRMSLEPTVSPDSIPDDQWQWMQEFQVWVANRKVFLYPENYLQPELRKNNSPLFTQLQDELKQGDLTPDKVEAAYSNYLSGLYDLAKLKIVGSHRHVVAADPNNPQVQAADTLYLLGRTATGPYVYYYRTLTADGQWSPWQKINVKIDADFVTPIFAFGRLFLFWASASEHGHSRERRPRPGDILRPNETVQDGIVVDKNANNTVEYEKYATYSLELQYSYLGNNQQWMQPQTFLDDVGEIPDVQYLEPKWQRVYALRSTGIAPGSMPSTFLAPWTPQAQTIPLVFQLKQLYFSFWMKVALTDAVKQGNVSRAQATKQVVLLQYSCQGASQLELRLRVEWPRWADEDKANQQLVQAAQALTQLTQLQAANAKSAQSVVNALNGAQGSIQQALSLLTSPSQAAALVDQTLISLAALSAGQPATATAPAVPAVDTSAVTQLLGQAKSALAASPAAADQASKDLAQAAQALTQLAELPSANARSAQSVVDALNGAQGSIQQALSSLTQESLSQAASSIAQTLSSLAALSAGQPATATAPAVPALDTSAVTQLLGQASSELTAAQAATPSLSLELWSHGKRYGCIKPPEQTWFQVSLDPTSSSASTSGAQNPYKFAIPQPVSFSSQQQQMVLGQGLDGNCQPLATNDNLPFDLGMAELHIWSPPPAASDDGCLVVGDEPNLRYYNRLGDAYASQDSNIDYLQLNPKASPQQQNKERILLFYGQSVYAMRGDREDSSIDLQFSLSPAAWGQSASSGSAPSTASYYDLDVYDTKLYSPKRAQYDFRLFDYAAPQLTQAPSGLTPELLQSVLGKLVDTVALLLTVDSYQAELTTGQGSVSTEQILGQLLAKEYPSSTLTVQGDLNTGQTTLQLSDDLLRMLLRSTFPDYWKSPQRQQEPEVSLPILGSLQ